MTMFIHFFCLCPLSLTIKLNFDISNVAYCSINLFGCVCSLCLFMWYLLQDEQEKLKKKKHLDFLDILLAARVIETSTSLVFQVTSTQMLGIKFSVCFEGRRESFFEN